MTNLPDTFEINVDKLTGSIKEMPSCNSAVLRVNGLSIGLAPDSLVLMPDANGSTVPTFEDVVALQAWIYQVVDGFFALPNFDELVENARKDVAH